MFLTMNPGKRGYLPEVSQWNNGMLEEWIIGYEKRIMP
jgi:hypothetical protein